MVPVKRRQAFFALREPRSGQVTKKHQMCLLCLCSGQTHPRVASRAGCRLIGAHSAVTSDPGQCLYVCQVREHRKHVLVCDREASVSTWTSTEAQSF